MGYGKQEVRLTERESDVLHLANHGLSDSAIAEVLGLGKGTIDSYWTRIRLRFGVSSRLEALKIYRSLYPSTEQCDSEVGTVADLEDQQSLIEAFPSRSRNISISEGHRAIVQEFYREENQVATTHVSDHEKTIAQVKKEAERKFRLLRDSIMDAFVSVTMDGQLLDFNEAYQNMLGYSADELHRLTYHDLTPSKWHRFEARIVKEQILTKGFSEIYEKEYRHKDGTVFPVELRSTISRNAIGEPIGMWAIVRDISERKATERALKESESKYRALFESANDGVFLICDGRFIDCNPVALRMFRCQKHQMVGQAPYMVSPELQLDGRPSKEKALDLIDQAIHGIPLIFDWIHQRFNGELFDTEVSLGAIQLDGKTHVHAIVRDVTDRKKSELALKESEIKFRQTFELLPVGACIVGLDYRFKGCNKAYCDFIGYSEEELLGKTFLDITYPEDLDVGMEETRAIEQGKTETCRIVKRYVRKDRQIAWGELTITLVKDAQGNPVHFLPIIIDITGRTKAEEALKESEAKFKAIFRSSRDAIGVSKAGIHTYVNPAYVSLFGFSDVEEVLSTPILDRIAPESYDVVARNLDLRVKGLPAPEFYEVTALKKDGSTFLMEMNVTTFVLDGEISTLVVLRDVTERHQSEEALRKSEKKFSQAFAASPEAASISSMVDETYLDVNEGFLESTGYSRHEVIGRRAVDLNLLLPNSGRNAYIEQLKKHHRVRNFESRFQTRSGEMRDLLVSGEIIEIDNVEYCLNFYRDITEIKQAERVLREARDELEIRVAERTAQLEGANKELEAFSYSVSHDLRAPLRALDGFSRILLEDYSTRMNIEGKYYLHRIGDAAVRMGQLVDDLLKLSRINRAELRIQDVDLSSVVNDIVRKIVESDPEREVEFVIARNVVVQGDATLLCSMMDNLINNAWKYTSKQDKARIEFGTYERDGLPVYFVRDDGAGFDMAHVNQLFGAFHRLHSESEYPGTGIGLATVHRIIVRHGGSIWAEASMGQGATFFFTLGHASC